jgi:hypothetical protein
MPSRPVLAIFVTVINALFWTLLALVVPVELLKPGLAIQTRTFVKGGVIPDQWGGEKVDHFTGRRGFGSKDEKAITVETAQNLTLDIILGIGSVRDTVTVDDVDAFYQMGQRLTQLTYNSENHHGDGCKVSHDRGLTEFGVEEVGQPHCLLTRIIGSDFGQTETRR